ncbi:OLC1v1035883C1 [Oldenlandia corymbosa var. corymbosa]|uniref:OLC1v1035883C1 n=1 Tax=Oldenlandia corymbosa var. corymbosa TaxID=529605 RepID=A0AAV1CUH6_OLDCO|nr:OLC1v1035883C1 [Oldenlandia corymbosa var. corymbosa]
MARRRTLIPHTHRHPKSRLSSSQSPLLPGPPPSDFSPDEALYRTLKKPRLTYENGSETSSVSADFIAESGDLLTQIFVHLPPKSLFRFQAVSKLWRSTLRSPSFLRLRTRNVGAQFLFHRSYDGSEETHALDLNFISLDKAYVDTMSDVVSDMRNIFDFNQVVGFHSCNGLLAIALKSGCDQTIDFYVYNPTTRSCRLIPRRYVHNIYYPQLKPENIFPQTPRRFIALYIAFDPLQSEHYKLLYLWHEGSWVTCSSYASDTQIWRDCEWVFDDEDAEVEPDLKKGVLWNGDFFWVDPHGYTYCFDFKSGSMKTITALPPNALTGHTGEEEEHFSWPEIFYFGVSGGDLCLIGLTDPHAMLFEVHKMELDYSRWNFNGRFDLSPLRALCPSMFVEENFHVLDCLVDEKQNLPAELMISSPGKIVSYNLQDKEIADVVMEDPHVSPKKMSIFRWGEAFQYVETFVPV